VSAYPKVTVDTLPASAATAAGCSVCAGLPAAAGSSGASTCLAVAGAGMGACGSGSAAARGSVTVAAHEVVALTAAPTLEVGGAAGVQLHKQHAAVLDDVAAVSSNSSLSVRSCDTSAGACPPAGPCCCMCPVASGLAASAR
jgi:hypothetical protein